MSASKNKTAIIPFRISASDLYGLNALSDELNMKRSEIIRMLIKKAVKRGEI